MNRSILSTRLLLKTCLGIVFLLSFAGINAQVTARLQLPTMGLLLKSQLWNLALVNTSTENLLVQVEVFVTDASTGEKLFSGLSKVLSLSRGVMQVTPGNVGPVTYNAFSSAYASGGSPDGMLPMGRFVVCYGVIRLVSDSRQRITEECDLVSVESLSPPMLVTPAHEDELETRNPVFTWTAPGPRSPGSSLVYEWKLVEVQPKQSLQAALAQNLPVWSQQNLTTTSLFYGNGFPLLDTAKQYAWQVTAFNNRSPIGTSEAWSFRLQRDRAASAKAGTDYYVRLKRNEDEQVASVDDKLRYAYVNEANDLSVQPVLYWLSGTGRKKIADVTETPLRYGDNFLELDLRSYALRQNNFYLLEFTNSRGERWCVKFHYHKTN